MTTLYDFEFHCRKMVGTEYLIHLSHIDIYCVVTVIKIILMLSIQIIDML